MYAHKTLETGNFKKVRYIYISAYLYVHYFYIFYTRNKIFVILVVVVTIVKPFIFYKNIVVKVKKEKNWRKI